MRYNKSDIEKFIEMFGNSFHPIKTKTYFYLYSEVLDSEEDHIKIQALEHCLLVQVWDYETDENKIQWDKLDSEYFYLIPYEDIRELYFQKVTE